MKRSGGAAATPGEEGQLAYLLEEPQHLTRHEGASSNNCYYCGKRCKRIATHQYHTHCGRTYLHRLPQGRVVNFVRCPDCGLGDIPQSLLSNHQQSDACAVWLDANVRPGDEITRRGGVWGGGRGGVKW